MKHKHKQQFSCVKGKLQISTSFPRPNQPKIFAQQRRIAPTRKIARRPVRIEREGTRGGIDTPLTYIQNEQVLYEKH